MYIDLEKLKLKPFDTSELTYIASEFKEHIELSLRGENSTLKMLPSLISDKTVCDRDMLILAIDIGGTNIRFGIFDFDHNTMTSKLIEEYDIFEAKNTLKKATIEAFTEYITDLLTAYLDGFMRTIDAVSISFSFAADIINNNGNLDASREKYSEKWGKGFEIMGSQTNITEHIRNALLMKGYSFNKWTTMNDVIALHLARKEAISALVVATGFNIAVMGANKELFNSHAARFTNRIIEENYIWKDDPFFSQIGISEGQISGRYLYKRFIKALLYFGEHNKEIYNLIAKYKTEFVSLVLKGEYDSLETELKTKIPEIRKEQYQTIAKALFERSTDLVSAELAGTLMYTMETNPELQSDLLNVNADGSVIRKMPNYKEEVEKKCSEILSRNVCINIVENSGIYGAAVAAVSDY